MEDEMENEKKFDPQKLFNAAETSSKSTTVKTGVDLMRKIVMDIFNNNVLLSPEENIALAQDMLKHGTGMSYDKLVIFWYSQWERRPK
jgi:hypothetical protein